VARDPFRNEIAGKFKDAIAALRISKAQAARDLGISRQMLYEYLSGKSLPKHTVLERACTFWHLELNYKDFLVTSTAFSKASAVPRATTPIQLDLLTAVEALRDEDLDIKILRKGSGRIELRVGLRFGTG
jgi:transcriptional regulator with XRE-family HTH domain